MRFRPVLSCCLLGTALVALHAQEPPLPAAATQETPAAPIPVPSVPQLIPDEVLPAAAPRPSPPGLPQLDEAFKDKPLSAIAADQNARREWRTLRNAVANDPAAKAAYADAERARTDLEKRKLLRRYYEILYGKMMARATSPAMKSYLNDRKNEHLNTLPQPHVRPETAPKPASSPPQTSAQPQVTPSPSPQPTAPALPFATPTPVVPR
jgi:hypothetical protein